MVNDDKKIVTYVGDYEVIDNKVVHVSNSNHLVIKVDSIKIKFEFSGDGKNPPSTTFRVEEKTLIISCVDYVYAGSGIVEPLEIARFQGKPLYICFYVKGLGRVDAGIREITYTLYQK
ncbi:MAG: hypothetical protein IKQ08_04595 [Paludibacteraceae bacterium]|nr:hypothetical protein [Paludibacteraceae bacterium]